MPFCLAKPQWLQRYVAAKDRKFRADGAFSLDGFFYRFAPAALCAHEGDAFTLASSFVRAPEHVRCALPVQTARGSRFRATNSPQYTFIAVSWRQPLAESI